LCDTVNARLGDRSRGILTEKVRNVSGESRARLEMFPCHENFLNEALAGEGEAPPGGDGGEDNALITKQ
jgi:hypothetical protein